MNAILTNPLQMNLWTLEKATIKCLLKTGCPKTSTNDENELNV